MKHTLPCIVIQRCVYVKRYQYSWTHKNEVGGSFGIGNFHTLKSCLASALKNEANRNIPIYINTVDWNYETDTPIETLTLMPTLTKGSA